MGSTGGLTSYQIILLELLLGVLMDICVILSSYSMGHFPLLSLVLYYIAYEVDQGVLLSSSFPPCRNEHRLVVPQLSRAC